MGPAYFVIAILGCGDGSVDCRQVATLPTRYATQAQCAAAIADALVRHSDLDFPTLAAECRAEESPVGAERRDVRPIPADAERG